MPQAPPITCSATHTVTQADIDAGSYLNTACVSATDATATCDDVDVPSVKNPDLSIEKRVTETTYGAVGDILHYTIVATNVGNVTLHNVVVTDPKVSGLICGDGTNLAPGGSIICNATHTVTQADIDCRPLPEHGLRHRHRGSMRRARVPLSPPPY